MKLKYVILLLALFATILSANPIPGEYPLAFGYTPEGNGPMIDFFRFYLCSIDDYEMNYNIDIFDENGDSIPAMAGFPTLTHLEACSIYTDSSLTDYRLIHVWSESSAITPEFFNMFFPYGGYIEVVDSIHSYSFGEYYFGDYMRLPDEAMTINQPLTWNGWYDSPIHAGPFPDSCYLWVRTFVRRTWTPPWDDIPVTSYNFCNYMHIPEAVLDTTPFGSLPFSYAPDCPQVTEIKLRGAGRYIEIYNTSLTIFDLADFAFINLGRCEVSGYMFPGQYRIIPEISWGDMVVDPTGGGIAIVKRDDEGFEHFCTGVAWGNWTDASKSLTWTGDSGWVARPPSPGVIEMSITEHSPLPAAVSILSAQPNPFNDAASIGYEFAHGVTEAEIGVFDMLGRQVLSRRLSDIRPGYHETKIAALPASGTYLVRIETNRGSDERKITYLK